MISYLTRNIIVARPGGGPLFGTDEGDRIFCRLDRYAIIPIEEYEGLMRVVEEVNARTAKDEINRIMKSNMEEK